MDGGFFLIHPPNGVERSVDEEEWMVIVLNIPGNLDSCHNLLQGFPITIRGYLPLPGSSRGEWMPFISLEVVLGNSVPGDGGLLT